MKKNQDKLIEEAILKATNKVALQLEKGLRQVKRKIAVSFMFKNSNRMKDYATILSYFETCYRHGISRYEASRRLSSGNPYTVEELSSIHKNTTKN